jgi:hypothetical protein
MNEERKIYPLAVHYVLDTLTDEEVIIILTLKGEEWELFKQMIKHLSAPMA